jgi:hypothetical protein
VRRNNSTSLLLIVVIIIISNDRCDAQVLEIGGGFSYGLGCGYFFVHLLARVVLVRFVA